MRDCYTIKSRYSQRYYNSNKIFGWELLYLYIYIIKSINFYVIW